MELLQSSTKPSKYTIIVAYPFLHHFIDFIFDIQSEWF